MESVNLAGDEYCKFVSFSFQYADGVYSKLMYDNWKMSGDKKFYVLT